VSSIEAVAWTEFLPASLRDKALEVAKLSVVADSELVSRLTPIEEAVITLEREGQVLDEELVDDVLRQSLESEKFRAFGECGQVLIVVDLRLEHRLNLLLLSATRLNFRKKITGPMVFGQSGGSQVGGYVV